MKGHKIWVFPDMEMPPITDPCLTAHESVIILNLCETDANINISLYFTDRPPVLGISVKVGANRVRCLRTDNASDFGGVIIERELQYALKLESDVPVVAQYGRLDTRQSNMAFYTVMGYAQD